MSRLKLITKKIISLVMIAGILLYGGILRINYASAMFLDMETVENNIIESGTLAFIASGSDFSPNITPTADSTRTIDFQNTGSLDFIYQVRTANISTSTLCDTLELKDDISGVFKPLTSFLSATSAVSVLPSVVFETRLATSSQSLSSQSCQFDLVITGWQTNFSDSSFGFSHTQAVSSTITAGDWQETSLPPPSPHTVVAGDVVINELMWMGSTGNSDDEWIELRNMTNYDIDISGWQLTSLTGSSNTENLMVTIPSGKNIIANGYFFASNFSEASSSISAIPDLVDSDVILRNANLQIKLYKDDWTSIANLIDIADDGLGAPLKGSSANYYSMERNSAPGDGALAGSWHSCVDASSTVLYWDAGRTEMGTPGAINLSDENLPAVDLAVIFEGLLIEDAASTSEEAINETSTATTTEETVPENIPLDDQSSGAPIDDSEPAKTDEVLDLDQILPAPDAGSSD